MAIRQKMIVRGLSISLLVGVPACGSTIGALDELPDGPDVSAVDWPLLVDTPAAPEGRLTSGTGERAAARLGERRSALEGRQAEASAIDPVSDGLVARGSSNLARVDAVRYSFDETGLMARATELQRRVETPPSQINEAELIERAARQQQRASIAPASSGIETLGRPVPLRPLDAPVVSSSFEVRAKRARERAANAGS